MSMAPDKLAQLAAQAADDKKGMNVTVLDLRGVSLLADFFIICHGNNENQVQAIAGEIRKKSEEQGVSVRGIEGYDAARWVLIDLGDVVAHVFHRDDRDYYNIERLWADAKVVELV